MKTTKGGKVMNPTDAYRKELRKKELKRNKKERKKVREVGILKKDPQQIMEQIQKLEMMKAEGALDKARKHKKRQLEDTLNLVMKKRKEYEDKMKEKGETSVMFSHLGPPRKRTTAEDEERMKHPKPEDSVYYHPTLNPMGTPPPGKPPMYKSLSGLRIPLSGESSNASASASQAENEDGHFAVPPPPPPPPLPDTANLIVDGSTLPASLPLPPPPPMPPKPAATSSGLPLPPPPPPPPGPPPRDQVPMRPPLPPPPPLPQAVQPVPPGIEGDRDRNVSALQGASVSQELPQVPTALPPPPPLPAMASNLGSSESEIAPLESNTIATTTISDPSKVLPLPPPPPPPPRQQPAVHGPAMLPNVQPDVLPPGISRFNPPPPPPDLRTPLSGPGIPGQAPPAMMFPLIARPPYGLPPGPPLMMRPPFPPSTVPVVQEDEFAADKPATLKPSYVKSAAPTVVKRPLAQHQPELTSMVPASVRVRRENVGSKPKPKSYVPIAVSTTTKSISPIVGRPEPANLTSAQKPQSIDDSYNAFLEDMKALGALDS